MQMQMQMQTIGKRLERPLFLLFLLLLLCVVIAGMMEKLTKEDCLKQDTTTTLRIEIIK
jgi:hypothetical protein